MAPGRCGHSLAVETARGWQYTIPGEKGAPEMLARVQQQGMQMIGKADQTMDPIFDQLAGPRGDYTRFLVAVDKTEKAVRFHQSAVIANISCLSQIRIEVERNFPAEEGQRTGTEIFEQTAAAYKEQVQPKFEETYEARCFGPLTAYKAELDECNLIIKKRGAAQLDYDVARSSVRGLIAKPGLDPSMLQHAEARQAELQTVYLAANDEAIAKMRKIMAEKDTFFSHFLKGVMEATATVTAGANKQIVPRIKLMEQYIESVPDAVGAEAEDIKLKEVGASPPAAAAQQSEFGGAAPQMSTIDQRVTEGDGMFGGVSGMASEYGAPAPAPMMAPPQQFGAPAADQFGVPPPQQFAPAPAPVFAPAPAPPPPTADPWDNMLGGGGGSAI